MKIFPKVLSISLAAGLLCVAGVILCVLNPAQKQDGMRLVPGCF